MSFNAENKDHEIWKHWPMPQFEPRDTQKIALEWMAKQPAHIKYVLAEIPVGGGKSPIALTYTGFLGRGQFSSSFILTPQRILQRQYEESFDNDVIASVYGKSNYNCSSKFTNCDIGDDIKPKCDGCPAKEAFHRALDTPNMVLNYKLAFLYFDILPYETMPKRDLMVMDECHSLESMLTDHRAVSISEMMCDRLRIKYTKFKDLPNAHEWLGNEYMEGLLSEFSKLSQSVASIKDEQNFNPHPLSGEDIRTLKRYKALKRHKDSVKYIAETPIEEVVDEFVLVPDKTRMLFKELYGKKLFHSLIKPRANKFLLMSSTILDKEAYCADLGIDPEESAMISLGSEFDKKNRPTFFLPTTKMSYGWNKPENSAKREKMLQKVCDICKIHENDSGIIHTGSFQVSKWLVDELAGGVSHRILHHNPESEIKRDDVVKEFTENDGVEPTILISPSITEGLDLKHDQARFAIFCKVPYPYLGDNWVKRRMELSNEWYQRQALINIIQGAGRVVRTETDWGNTYILDASFSFLLYRMGKKLPTWWKEALIK